MTAQSMKLAVALATLAVLAPAVRAENAALLVGGAVKGKERTELTDAARSAAEAASWIVVTPQVTSSAAACIDSADRAACVPKLVNPAKVERVIVLRVAKEERDGAVMQVVTGWVFQVDGTLVVADRRFCEQCTGDKLRAAAKELTSAMLQRARTPAKLAIRSTPPGALVFVDDIPVGATDTDYGIYAGVHVVRVEKQGYESATRTVTLTDGETMTVEFPLRKIATNPTRDDRPAPPGPGAATSSTSTSSFDLLPLGLSIGGGALLVTGGVLFLMDQPESENGEKVPRHRETTIEAIGAVTAGAVAGGIGLYLLFFASESKPAPAPRGPVVGVQGGGAWLGYRGTF